MAEEITREKVVIEKEPEQASTSGPTTIVARIISFIGAVIVVVLGIRFVFMLLGASQANAFVSFIYSFSHPFAAPFFGMFAYEPVLGQSRLEVETLVAMVVYALITSALVYLVTIGKRRSTV